MPRIDKHNYYLNIAEVVLERGSCLRRIFGAVIVNRDKVISSGYNGAPRGRQNCIDRGVCMRQEFKVPSGERYELCRSVHAETNAVIHASHEETTGSSLYLVGKETKNNIYVNGTTPCSMCKRVIINAGIETLITRIDKENFIITKVCQWIENDETLEEFRGY